MDPRNGMDTPSGAARSSLGPPSALPASRIPIQQTWLTTDAASAAAILLLLLAFVVWPVLRVLATSLAGPAGLTLGNYADFVVSQVFTFLPQGYILLVNVLGAIDVSLEEAAENLGAGPLTTLRRVTLSLARPGLASAALIVFILCMTDFGNPILIGGRYNVLATEIYAQVIGMSNFAAGATMSVVLIVPCLVAYLVNASWVGTRSYVTVSAGARVVARPMPPALRWPLFVLSGG